VDERRFAASHGERVLQLVAEDIVGGTELMVTQMAERMDALGMRVEVATFFPPGPQARRLAAGGIPVWSLGGSGPLVASKRLAGLLRHRDYDVVEAHGFKMSVAARLIAAIMQPRVIRICSVQGLHITEVVELDEAKGRFALAVECALTQLVDGYAVNSRRAIDLLASHGIDPQKMKYIPTAIDTAFWTSRETQSTREQPPVIVCSGRFVERKRQEDLIEAAHLLDRRGVAFKLVLAGGGPTRRRCEDSVRVRGLQERVEFPGALSHDELRPLLHSATVCALVSLWEGLPAALLEAMATGLPIVGTNVNGTADLVVDGRTGLLVPPRNPRQLADALASLLLDDRRAAEMGAAGRREIEARYDFTSTIQARRELYRDSAARRAGDRARVRGYSR
jgi:glycosyltransferase involved in cell wall biosynthesis